MAPSPLLLPNWRLIKLPDVLLKSLERAVFNEAPSPKKTLLRANKKLPDYVPTLHGLPGLIMTGIPTASRRRGDPRDQQETHGIPLWNMSMLLF